MNTYYQKKVERLGIGIQKKMFLMLFGKSNYHVDNHKDIDIDGTYNKGPLIDYFGKVYKICCCLVGFRITTPYFQNF